MAPTKEPTAWEKAKPILQELYLSNRITDSMKPSEVLGKFPEFKAVPYKNFCDNFRRLKNSIKAHKARALEEMDMLQMDLGIYTLAKDKDELWDGSEAQRLLKEDVENNRHIGIKPKALRLTRIQYQKFELKQFRDHLTQEIRDKLLVGQTKEETNVEDGAD